MVAPATADLLARMAAGIADDLATTLLLATDKPVLAAPAMNVRMWEHAATRRNVARLRARRRHGAGARRGRDGLRRIWPGRLPRAGGDPRRDRRAALGAGRRPLAGRHVIVTAGPTHEPIDPVRFIANRSSGKQGFAIAGALGGAGRARDVGGRAGRPADPRRASTRRRRRDRARDGSRPSSAALPADAAVMVAAVADWRVGSPAPRSSRRRRRARPARPGRKTPTSSPGLAARRGARPARRLRGRDRAMSSTHAAGQARAQGRRLDRRQRRVRRRDGRGRQCRSPRHRADGVEDWDRRPKAEVARRLAAAHRRGTARTG